MNLLCLRDEYNLKFPLPIIRFSTEKIGDKQRHVFTQNLVADAGTELERLVIMGDDFSKKRAGQFIMYRDMRSYKPPSREEIAPYTVFYSPKESVKYQNSHYGANIWAPKAAKTQGYPYHLLILAIGIYLEQKYSFFFFSL